MANIVRGKQVPANDVQVEVQREVDGLEMGVLQDGTPYLTSRGLARLCGVVPGAILGWLPTFDASSAKPRDVKLRALLQTQGHHGGPLQVKAKASQGKQVAPVIVNAHPDSVCMAVLEYYAFEAGAGVTEQALTAFRLLARRSLREFIYTSVGYDPDNLLPEKWKHYHDRLLLNPAPRGRFSVFTESADVIVSAIRNGLIVDEHTVPDISVGQAWAHHWREMGGDNRFGARARHPHKFPDYFPQSAAQVECWVYPILSLGEFRSWLHEVYIPTKYPKYLTGKVKTGALPASRAELLLAAVVVKDEDDEN